MTFSRDALRWRVAAKRELFFGTWQQFVHIRQSQGSGGHHLRPLSQIVLANHFHCIGLRMVPEAVAGDFLVVSTTRHTPAIERRMIATAETAGAQFLDAPGTI